jgi:DNA repair protein RecN (Recombination protein N)
MLTTLSIRDVVLIDRLDLTFRPALSVLTGETGAGKSILLDALGLALGVRADSDLVRHGAERASVTAAFEVDDDHPAHAVLAAHDLDTDGATLLLRRTLSADGRSRAFVNDQPVSVALLRDVGETLVEVHGQFESQGLLNPATHRLLLDAYGGLEAGVGQCAETHAGWRLAASAVAATEADLEAARRDEEYLRHAVAELEGLAPQPGEEAALAERRSLLRHGEKLLEAVNEAAAVLAEGRGIDGPLRAALAHLERAADKAEGRLDAARAALERAIAETADATTEIASLGTAIDLDPRSLEEVEERLFALRALARKHDVAVDDLAALAETLARRLADLDAGGADLDRLRDAEATAWTAFAEAARRLSTSRKAAASRLDAAVAAELAPLKLDEASFETAVENLPDEAWGADGGDRVGFRVATNPGVPMGPLRSVSSGGELARFMLALKVVLADADAVPTLVFDEVDSGVGGAVAAAVGERLARLAEDYQVLVVTHSPQVAARGAHHWRVSKSEARPDVLTTVDALPDGDRKEEIARMLAGARVTDEARAAADSLLQGAKS